jgi:hypothetical protein
MNARISRLYAGYAVVLLGLTLLAGVYLRAAFIWPSVRGGIPTPQVIHAHSHAGFFGWMVMAAAAALVGRVAAMSPNVARAHRLLAHAIGIGSFAAFIGFALRGYDVATITLSALHVGLWVMLAALLWRPLRDTPEADDGGLLRGALVFLVASGAATIVPGMMMVRQVTDPWLVQFGVKLFLTPFVSGFLLLTALGLVYAHIRRGHQATTVLYLIAVGTLPSTLLYVPGPPLPLLTLLGRFGIGMVGAALVLFAADVAISRWTRRRGADRLETLHADDGLRATSPAGEAGESLRLLSPAALVVIAAAAAGVVKLLAAAGVGADFMHNRSIVIAVLHLLLLGVVTPAFVVALSPGMRAPIRSACYAGGLALMLVPLVAMGWPWATRLLMMRGVGIDTMLAASAVGGIAAAIALLALCVPAGGTSLPGSLPGGGQVEGARNGDASEAVPGNDAVSASAGSANDPVSTNDRVTAASGT